MLLLRVSGMFVSILLDRMNINSYCQNFITTFLQICGAVFQVSHVMDCSTQVYSSFHVWSSLWNSLQNLADKAADSFEFVLAAWDAGG